MQKEIHVTFTKRIPVWTAIVGVSLFTLPWHIAKIITGSSWVNPHQFAVAIQNGFLKDLNSNIPTPGYENSYLTNETQFWFWFHLSKAFISLILFILIFLYTRELDKNYHFSGSRLLGIIHLTKKIALHTLCFFSFLILAANIQGSIAPLSSIISFLPASKHDYLLSESVQKLRFDLLSSDSNSFASSVLRDFSIYHLTTAVIFGIAALYLFKNLYLSVKNRNFSAMFVAGILGIGFLLLGIANLGTTFHPIPAFDGFLSGFSG